MSDGRFFQKKDSFETIEAAEQHFEEQLERLNSRRKPPLEGKSPHDLLNEERSYLLPLKPTYDIARVSEYRVDKYSVISVDSNKYSVPDYLVGKFVEARIYPDHVDVFHHGVMVATHRRSYTNHDWIIDIMHYTRTLKKKPGALHKSVARRQLEPELQNIYTRYYTTKPKDFIDLLEVIDKHGLEKICRAIEKLSAIKQSIVTTDNILNLVNHVPVERNDQQVDTAIEKASVELIMMANQLFKLGSTGGLVN